MPGIGHLLPKPGGWMEVLRQALAFPVYASVLWLVWVASREGGGDLLLAAGGGMLLVPPGDVERLSQRIDELASDPDGLLETGRRARATVAAYFTWPRCGRETVAAYADALR